MIADILITDDNPANLLALKAVLSSPKHNLVEAESGQDALKLCQEKEFALILLDIQMPGIDGFETARRIKTETKNKDVPIIFVTATYSEDPFVKRGFEAGAIDYFGKPFDPDILRLKVGFYTDLFLRTKRLHETEELLKTHAQIKTLLEAMPVGVMVADASGRIYESNEEAARIWGGIRNVDVEDRSHYKGRWPDSGKELHDNEWAIVRALERGETSKEELVEIESFDGHQKTILSSAYPIRGKQDQILGAVAVIQDVTARKEAAQGFQQKVIDLLGNNSSFSS